MLVQRHRLDTELLAEPAHGQRLGAVGIGERESGPQHPLGTQRLPWSRARLGPRCHRPSLAGLGVASFALMLVGTVVSLLLPQYRDLAMAAWAPGIVFEVTIGVWLLLKGIRTQAPPARRGPGAVPRSGTQSTSLASR
jgi:Domain of unknown function (DUF4386)